MENRVGSDVHNHRLGIALAWLTVSLVWGSTYLAIRMTLTGFPPFLSAGLRFLVAGGVLFLFQRFRGVPVPTRKEWRGAILIGALLLLGGNGGVVFAEQWVASGLAALVVATLPLWAALFAGLWGRWPTKVEWLGLGLGFAGVGLLNLEGNLRANPLGAVALLFAAASWAFGSIWSRHLALPKGLMASAAQMLAGGALLTLASLAVREKLTHPPAGTALLGISYLVIFGSLVAYTAYTYLLSYARPALATSYAYVNPVVAVVLGVSFAGERITLIGILGMLIILGGVCLVALGKKQV